jgi:hypothetical protein
VRELTAPSPRRRIDERPLIRRLLPRPRPLLAGPPDLVRTGAESLLRAANGPASGSPDTGNRGRFRIHGPHLLSGGWWTRESRRVYHFLEAEEGPLYWIFYDEDRKRWYLQGRVE